MRITLSLLQATYNKLKQSVLWGPPVLLESEQAANKLLKKLVTWTCFVNMDNTYLKTSKQGFS